MIKYVDVRLRDYPDAKNMKYCLPKLQGLLPFDRARVPADIIAGLTLAALAIPEVMSYTIKCTMLFQKIRKKQSPDGLIPFDF